MRKPFFSIIIPTLNEELFVGKLLNDLCKQSYNNYEIIIVDAHSSDKTLDIVQEYATRLPIKKVVSLKKRNVSLQRNTGSQYASGPYLVFLDSDSRIRKTFLKKLEKYIRINKGLLFIPALYIAKKDPQLNIAVDFSNTLVAISIKIGKPFSTGGSMIVEKNFFHTINGFPEDVPLSEHHLLVRNAYKFGVQAKFLNNIKVEFSLRRFYREGKLELLLKYIKSTIYFLAKGKIDTQIIEYEMGGHLYQNKEKKDFLQSLKENSNYLLKQLNIKNLHSTLKTLLTDE